MNTSMTSAFDTRFQNKVDKAKRAPVMNLLDLPIRKRPRRSCRLQLKGLQQEKMRQVAHCPTGFFDTLPTMAVYSIFECLGAVDLSLLTVTSKSTRALVEAWLATPRAMVHLLPPRAFTDPAGRPGIGLIRMFQRLGVLLKRTTCLYFTNTRLNMLWAFIERVDAYWWGINPGVPSIVQLACSGRFLHTAIAGWEDCECDKVFRTVEKRIIPRRMLGHVLTSSPGSDKQAEVDIRLCYRLLFLDPCRSAREREAWMCRVLRHHPIVHQTRLIYMMYGPRTQKEVLWEETTDSVPSCEQEAVRHFAELATALSRLTNYAAWSDAELADLLELLVATPEPWLPENVACLLLLADDRVAVLLLARRVRNNVDEAAHLLGAVCIMALKLGKGQQWLVSVVQQVCGAVGSRERTSLVQAVWDSFSAQLMDLWDQRRTEQEEQERHPDLLEEDMQLLLAAHAEFGRALLAYAVKHHSR